MDFTFTDEQRMMAAALRELTGDLCSGTKLRAAFEGKEDAHALRWERVAEMGLVGMRAPERYGGLGLADVDCALIAEESGRSAWPDPLIEQAGIAIPLLAEFADDASRVQDTLRAAAHGDLRIAVVHPLNPFVDGADRTANLIVCREHDVHLVATGDTALVSQPSIDALRRLYRVDAKLDGSTLLADGEKARAAVERAGRRGAVFVAAQSLGLAERMIALAVEYAAGRQQFGKPIGSYQAIKHHLASAQVKLEFARPVVYAAAAGIAQSGRRAVAAASHAKLAATDAADLAARTAIQAHGAMGYSWEVDLHFYMKRAWALAGAWGDRSLHARRIQSMLFDGALPLGPDGTFSGL